MFLPFILTPCPGFRLLATFVETCIAESELHFLTNFYTTRLSLKDLIYSVQSLIWKNVIRHHNPPLAHGIIFGGCANATKKTGYSQGALWELPGGTWRAPAHRKHAEGGKWWDTQTHLSGCIQPTVHDLQRATANYPLSQSQHHSTVRILICLLQFPGAGSCQLKSSLWSESG